MNGGAVNAGPGSPGRIVIAGVGNIFLSDDGFGAEVARRLAQRSAQWPLPGGVEVTDVGIRSVHLAFDLLDGCDLLILADAAQRGEQPGTVTVLDVDPAAGTREALGTQALESGVFDAHDLSPDGLIMLLGSMGARIGRIVAVVCEPGETGPGIGLSAPVEAAVDVAAGLIARLAAGEAVTSPGRGTDRNGQDREPRRMRVR